MGKKTTKNKRTIRAYVNSKSKKGSYVTLHSLCICRPTLACISSEISTKLLGMPPHPDWPSLTASFCWLLSAAPPRHPSPTAFSAFLFSTLFSSVPLPPSGRVEDLELRPLFGFVPKQTKRSSAWRTHFIVLHPKTNRCWHAVKISHDFREYSMNS